MASTSYTFTFTPLATPSAHFNGSKPKAPTRVHFRSAPPRISAAFASTTAERPRPHVSSSPSSLYEVLGIQTSATYQEVKAAYRRLARVLHPDVYAGAGMQAEDTAQDFIKVQEAYSTLSDPEKRADYDRNMLLFRRRRSMGSSCAVSASGFRPPRSWETDQCW